MNDTAKSLLTSDLRYLVRNYTDTKDAGKLNFDEAISILIREYKDDQDLVEFILSRIEDNCDK